MDEYTKPRVFISSVMTGYEAVRAAAYQAIKETGFIPILADDISYYPTSPRNACLDGINSSDGVVLILGARYGGVLDIGFSATEDEYREAKRLKKSIFVFVENVEKEERQEDFIRSISGYVSGHWRKTFSSIGELAQQIKDALKEGMLMINSKEAAQKAANRIAVAFSQQSTKDNRAATFNNDHIATLQVVWATLRDEQVISPANFLDKRFIQEVFNVALNGDHPLFEHSYPKSEKKDASFIRLEQQDPNGRRMGTTNLAAVTLFADGTVSVSLNVTGLEKRVHNDLNLSFADMTWLNPKRVEERLIQAWSFIKDWWDYRDNLHKHEGFLYNLAIHNIGERFLGWPEPGDGRVATLRQRDPFMVHNYAVLVNRQDMNNSDNQLSQDIAHLELSYEKRPY